MMGFGFLSATRVIDATLSTLASTDKGTMSAISTVSVTFSSTALSSALWSVPKTALTASSGEAAKKVCGGSAAHTPRGASIPAATPVEATAPLTAACIKVLRVMLMIATILVVEVYRLPRRKDDPSSATALRTPRLRSGVYTWREIADHPVAR